jgi:hypothetical protein
MNKINCFRFRFFNKLFLKFCNLSNQKNVILILLLSIVDIFNFYLIRINEVLLLMVFAISRQYYSCNFQEKES